MPAPYPGHYNNSPSGDARCQRRGKRRERKLYTPRQRPVTVRYRPVRRRRSPMSPLLLLPLFVVVGLLVFSRSRVSANHSNAATVAAVATMTPLPPSPSPSPGAAFAVLPVFHQPTATPTATATALPTATSTSSPTPTPMYSDTWLLAHSPTKPPAISAKAAIVIDYDTHQVLYQSNPHERLAQASTTKLTLADVALDVASPDLPITISKDATEVVPDHMG
ncbi:MAG TPA: hypothetical protein VIU62_09620, partial [Chloroflexota bacterium]